MYLDIEKLLTPNRLITLEVGSEMNRYAYASRIESMGSDKLTVATPSERGSLVIMQPGTEVRGFLNHEGGKFFFVSVVIGHQLDPLPMLMLTKPDRLIKGQRRHFLRVKATIFPIESWVIDTDPEECRPIKIATLDISGGGLRFVGIDELEKDTHVRIKIDLPFECGIVDTIARVIRSEERQEASRFRFESAAIFEDITEGDRDRICKFALKQQLSSARTGIWKRQ